MSIQTSYSIPPAIENLIKNAGINNLDYENLSIEELQDRAELLLEKAHQEKALTSDAQSDAQSKKIFEENCKEEKAAVRQAVGSYYVNAQTKARYNNFAAARHDAFNYDYSTQKSDVNNMPLELLIIISLQGRSNSLEKHIRAKAKEMQERNNKSEQLARLRTMLSGLSSNPEQDITIAETEKERTELLITANLANITLDDYSDKSTQNDKLILSAGHLEKLKNQVTGAIENTTQNSSWEQQVLSELVKKNELSLETITMLQKAYHSTKQSIVQNIGR